jgi:hypothetical protein
VEENQENYLEIYPTACVDLSGEVTFTTPHSMGYFQTHCNVFLGKIVSMQFKKNSSARRPEGSLLLFYPR